jgi:protein O-mannosyl-transferase
MTKTHKNILNYRFVVITLILLLTALCFSNSIKNGFVNWDDNKQIVENPDIKDFSFKGVYKIFSTFYLGMYQPLTTLSYAIEYKLSGVKPSVYHFSNLIFHLLNTLLVYIFILSLTKRREAAAIVAALFAVHPLHVESVSWVSERKDVLYAAFYLASLIAWIYYLRYQYKFKYYVMTLIFFILSLLSKSAAVTLPLILLIIDYFHNRKLNLKNIPDKIPFFFLSLGFGIISLFSQHVVDPNSVSVSHFNFLDRIFLGSFSFNWYVIEAIVPFKLCALHPLPVKTNGALPLIYYFSILSIVLFLLLLFKIYQAVSLKRETKKELLFGLLFFVFTIGLILFIPVGQAVVAERYTYIPYLGLFFIIAMFYCRAVDAKSKLEKKLYPYYNLILIALLVFFSIFTYNRNKIWENSLVFFSDIIQKHPNEAAVAYNNRGLEKKAISDVSGALLDYNKALQINPNYAEAYSNRGLLYKDISNLPEALKDLNNAVRLNPDLFEAYYNRGLIYNQFQQYDLAIQDFNQAIAKYPKLEVAFLDRGISKAMLGDINGAIGDFSYAIELKPDFVTAYHNRALAKRTLNDLQGACKDWKIASLLGYPKADENLAKYCN